MQAIKTRPMRCWPVKTNLYIFKKSDRPTLNKMARPSGICQNCQMANPPLNLTHLNSLSNGMTNFQSRVNVFPIATGTWRRLVLF